VDEGLKHTSCVNLCNVFTVPRHALSTFVGTVAPEKMRRVCSALAVAIACD
jgi:mRNA-degrading endonuclease toxin of MazEF toxin-antitoxin module